jgi:hypothetical protein
MVLRMQLANDPDSNRRRTIITHAVEKKSP